MTTALFWSFYLAVGVITLVFALFSYEFLEGTSWWRKVLAVVFAVILWPVLLVILIFFS
jgi:hypothetical protein